MNEVDEEPDWGPDWTDEMEQSWKEWCEMANLEEYSMEWWMNEV